jgi:uncharacterized protein YkwD
VHWGWHGRGRPVRDPVLKSIAQFAHRKTPISAAMILAALMAAGCAGVQTTPPAPPDAKAQMRELELRIYSLVEAARLKLDPKATPLARDGELDGAARAHSRDMARRHYLAHSAPDGANTTAFLMARDAKFHGLLGENIAAQYLPRDGRLDIDATAKRFVVLWMNSKAHRSNLAYPAYSQTGLGVAEGGGMIYATQLFMADLPKQRPGKGKAVAPGPNVRLRGSRTGAKISPATP